MMKWLGFTFQNTSSLESMQLDWLHDFAIFFLIFILMLVGLSLISLLSNSYSSFFVNEFSILEIFWTVSPALILICIGLPSLMILYNMEKNLISNISVKISAHQWYWSYDYSDFNNVEFDSYMQPLDFLKKGDFRLLMTDNKVVLPVNSKCRFLVSSSDVLHSWTIPVLGIKADANPGRINTLFSNLIVCGMYCGQCSEICGANHSFMPICLDVVSFSMFKNWIKSF